MDEAAIIALISQLKSSRKNRIAGDDIGVLPWRGRVFAATDSLIENTHYRDKWLKPEDIAYKLFARNWSDFVCKGIYPEAALFNLSLRKRPHADRFVLQFLHALDKLFVRNGITLIGGDVARSKQDHFTLSFFGRHGNFIPRRAREIKAGDFVLQLGSVGKSDAGRIGLQKASNKDNKLARGFQKPHLFPQLPRNYRILATIDQSDSVAKSLHLLARENQVELEIELSAMQVAASYRRLVPIEKIPSASEDLAIFALGRDSKKSVAKSTAAFRRIGSVKTIRSDNPCVRYLWRGGAIRVRVDEFEHF